MKRLFISVYFILSLVLTSSCKNNSDGMAFLQDMDTRMDICPDSVLFELRAVESNMLNTRYLRAKYSLLHSIALDKNYLDLTNDSIIAPAVTYFDDKGSADERFKTRYYLGRIYQNSGDEDSAMDSFVDALELSENVTDRLAVARCWSAVATLYCNIYDFNKAIEADSMAGCKWRHPEFLTAK